MTNYFVIKLSTTGMFIIGTFIFAGVCFKRRDLFSWLFAFIAGSISEFFRLISQGDYDSYYITGLFFSSLTLILIIVAVSREYYYTFIRPIKTGVISIFILFLTQVVLSISLQIIIGILLLIAFYLSFRIFLKKKTPTHAFLSLILISGILNLIAISFRDGGIEGAEEFFLFSSAVMATNIFLTGLIALIEDRIVSSENKYRLAYNRAEFYKDLFVHDINNILQNLEFSLELMSQECDNYDIKDEMKELLILAKTQVNRGAELGVNVRKLSDLELGKIKTNPVQVNEILAKAIDYVKTRFPNKELSINTNSRERAYFVNASELLYDVFKIILNNAIRYNNNSKVDIDIDILLERLNEIDYVRMEFLDNGIGMPDVMKESVFYKIYETPKSFKRIGLGLLLAREAIENFNGKIWAEDRIKGDHEKGSKIIILIPEIP